MVPGEVLFFLNDSLGVPLEVVVDMATAEGVQVGLFGVRAVLAKSFC